MNKLWDYVKKGWIFIKKLLFENKEVTVQKISINAPSISGNVITNNINLKFENKETVTEFSNKLVLFLENHCMVDVNNEKFKYYINESLLILKLNDSKTKRYLLKELLYRKFSGSEYKRDDSDAPLTIALEAMRHLTDTALKHLCSYRLVVNTLPSIFDINKENFILSSIDFINQNGLMDQTEIMNFRRLGLIYAMDNKVYSIEEVTKRKDIQCITHIINPADQFIYSNTFSPAGIILSDLLLEFFLEIHDINQCWLEVKNKSLHLNGLVVDEDVMVLKNMIVQGDTSSGGGQ